jgi:hypothetical protein
MQSSEDKASNIYLSRLIPEGVVEASQIFLRDAHILPKWLNLAMRNTANVTGGKSIVVWLQSVSGGDTFNLLVTFYDIHERKKEVLFFCSVLDTTRDK